MKLHKYAMAFLTAGAMLAACSSQTPTATESAASSDAAGTAVSEAVSAAPANASPAADGTEAVSPQDAAAGYTAEEVAKHADATSCWTIVDRVVYDLTEFVSQHPGGNDKILAMCGKDAGDDFYKQHGNNDDAIAKLKSFELGPLKES